jgi:predicted MFS family arabinose efflux permease
MLFKNATIQKIYVYYGLVLTAYTAILILTKQVNIFFIIYLFWWDTLLHSLFIRFSLSKAERTEETRKNIHSVNSHFFMCFVHLVFVVVLFGFVMTGNEPVNSYIKTAQILLFRNWGFNIGIIIILLRELNTYYHQREMADEEKNYLITPGIIVMHLSIILGAFLWTAVSQNFWNIQSWLGESGSTIYILPFLLIKFISEYNSIRKKAKSNRSNFPHT